MGGDPVVEGRVASGGEGQQRLPGHVAVLGHIVAREYGERRVPGPPPTVQCFGEIAEHAYGVSRVQQIV